MEYSDTCTWNKMEVVIISYYLSNRFEFIYELTKMSIKIFNVLLGQYLASSTAKGNMS